MDIDYRLAFEMAPVGLALSRNRIMVDCNRHLCDMFGAAPDQLVGQSFKVLYPSDLEFERTGQRIAPLLRNVVASSGRHWSVSVRVSPFGNVTVNVGAYPCPCRYTRSPAIRSGWFTWMVVSRQVSDSRSSPAWYEMSEVNISA